MKTTASDSPSPRFENSPWIELVSGRRRGIGASIIRAGLSVLAPLYEMGIGIRNWSFERGWRGQTRVTVPVISVGNLTAGGTGKTPMVAWLVRMLQSSGVRPAIISRGYGSLGNEADGEPGKSVVNDEKLLLDRLLPGVPHVLNPRRIEAAQCLLDRPLSEQPDVLVLDDAFQHRQIMRDFDLVLVDCLNPWGYGYLLPRGLLREPKKSLSRASAIVLTRCDLVDEPFVQQLLTELRRWTNAPIYRSEFCPTRLINARGESKSIAEMAPRHIAAFCGIGNPMGFRRTLTGCGLAVPDDRFRVFPDHHHYSSDDFEQLGEWARSVKADCLLTTAKDLVKMADGSLGGTPVWAVEIELQWPDSKDGEQLADSICRLVR